MQAALQSERRGNTMAWLVVALALVANAPVLLAGFVLDDHPIVEDNRRVNEFRIAEIWKSSYWGTPDRVGEYRPAVLTSYALERRLFGPGAWHFHAVNWLLHGLVAFTLLAAGRAIGLSEPAAAIAAGIFALHPIHLDAIAPIVGRAELLAALALTGGTALWVQIRRSPALRFGPVAALAGCLALGAFSKETALAAVPLLLAVELLVVRAGGGASRRVVFGVTAVVVAAYLFARVSVLGGLVPAPGSSFSFIANPLGVEPWSVRLLTAAAIFARYLRIFAWPVALSPDYSFDSLPIVRSAGDPGVLFAVLVLAGLAVLAAVNFRRRPALTVAVVALLAPYSIVANAAFPIGTMLAERLFYLPSIGLCWLIGAGVAAAARRLTVFLPTPGRRAAALAIPALALAALSFARAGEWRDEERLYRAALHHYPRNAALWLTLGELAIRGGRYGVAIERMAQVNAIAPDFSKAWIDRGTLLAAGRQFTPAREALERGLSLDPENPLALRNLAIVERELGDPEAGSRLDARAAAIEARGRAAP